jgi:hypothetical protein
MNLPKLTSDKTRRLEATNNTNLTLHDMIKVEVIPGDDQNASKTMFDEFELIS